MAAGDNERNLPEVELYVRASTLDKVNIGAVPTDQQYFMAFHLLDQHQRLILKEVVTINADAPPRDYLDLNVGNALPVVHVVGGTSARGEDLTGLLLSHADDIDQFVDNFAVPYLRTAKASPDEATAEKVFLNLQTKFNLFLKDPKNEPGSLYQVLQKINTHLEQSGTTFLLSDELGFADCLLLPRLHHVLVAGRAYKNFQLPDNLPHLRRYIEASYKSEVFVQSCPADEDIVAQYTGKTSSAPLVNPRTRQSRTFTFELTE